MKSDPSNRDAANRPDDSGAGRDGIDRDRRRTPDARTVPGGVNRRDYLRALGGAVGTAGALTGVGPAAADPSEAHYHNPVGPVGMGDPTVLQWEDGTYYAYGTHRRFARSDDLVNWEDSSPVVDWEPDWHGDPEAGFWAPDVNYYDGQVYLYYSHSTWGSQDNPGIGLATADHPEGPFENHGPVFRDEDLSATNCIDSDLVVEDGTPYLIWGSFFGIWGVELTPDATDYVPGTEFHLAGDNREGPMIVRENGYYYLFLSTGHCCEGADSTYEVEVGRAESLFGPYYNRDGDDLRDVNEHHAGQTVLAGTDQFVGTGHNTAIQDDAGDWWMLYHVEATAEREERVMMLDRIHWDDADWPVVGCDGTPCTEAPRPTIGAVGCGSGDPDGEADDGAAGGSETVDGQTVCDVNDDGFYRDVNGDGSVGQGDVAEFFTKQHRSAWKQPDLFDFSENGAVTHGDVVELFDYVALN